jgi:hypothetical protein
MHNYSIAISADGLHVNSEKLTLPVPLDELIRIFGTPVGKTKKHNTIYTWNELGIFAYSADKKMVKSIVFHVREDKTYDFIPSSVFAGDITIEGKSYRDIQVPRQKKTDSLLLVIGTNQLFFDESDDHSITDIEISIYEAPPPLADPERYAFKAIAGQKIEFQDFNFKLAVVQVLMYEKYLLKPEFDVHQFVERYTAREIDVDAEGYHIIPEVKEYFERLEIDQKYAGEITEIYQDGGNDVYMHICPFWSGESDIFNIKSFEDVDQFRNLKKMTLFYDENMEQIQRDLQAKWI